MSCPVGLLYCAVAAAPGARSRLAVPSTQPHSGPLNRPDFSAETRLFESCRHGSQQGIPTLWSQFHNAMIFIEDCEPARTRTRGQGIMRNTNSVLLRGKYKKRNRFSGGPTERRPRATLYRTRSCRDSGWHAGKSKKCKWLWKPKSGPAPDRTSEPAIFAFHCPGVCIGGKRIPDTGSETQEAQICSFVLTSV
jgi:hypothetical protein